MKLNLFATKLEENHTYIIKNIVKRIAAQDDYVRVNYQIDKISNATSVSYRTTVGGTYIASGEISSKGNHTTKHINATYIDKGERILPSTACGFMITCAEMMFAAFLLISL